MVQKVEPAISLKVGDWAGLSQQWKGNPTEGGPTAEEDEARDNDNNDYNNDKTNFYACRNTFKSNCYTPG